jgi:hypothetical protein
MGKGANKQLLNNSGAGQYGNTTLSAKGAGISDFATPILESDVTNPKGYTPQQMAYMNTASQQSLGGSTAGITGQANLTAARTRNAGGFQGAVGSGSRAAQRQLSQNALGIEKSQADLQQQQREQAIQSLMKLYGVDESTALGYLNASTTALHDENQSHPNQEGLLTAGTFIKDLAGAASSAAQANQSAGCWIAAAVYNGWEDPRTIDVRRWLNTEFTKTLTGRVVMAAYMAIGREVAWFVKRSSLLRRAFKPLFDLALAKARA